MAFFGPRLTFFLCTIFFTTTFFIDNSLARTRTKSSHVNTFDQSAKSFCGNTPFPDVCFESLSLRIANKNKIPRNIINYLVHTVRVALVQSEKLSNIFASSYLVEKQNGTLQDCIDLHQITVSSLQRSILKIRKGDSKNLGTAKVFLSAALTNKNTCLDGLNYASGPMKRKLVRSITSMYKHVSNSLSVLAKKSPDNPNRNRRLNRSFPSWVTRKGRRILESVNSDYGQSGAFTVSTDGTGDFTTINDAIKAAPDNSEERIVIRIKQGVYNENIEISMNKPNIVLLGEGSDVTFIRGNRSVGDHWTTFNCATLAVSGDGFLARDLTIENTAGAAKFQAVALRISADSTALYRCNINGYQDTLYTHSFRQFYRECNISGSIDYIFGNAAAIFQGCNIISRKPLHGQATVITAQSRDAPAESTGISIQNCNILATQELRSSQDVESYMGRPWRDYSRVVVIESYIDNFIDPKGWSPWAGTRGLNTLYYGEYDNYGPGSGTDYRVDWLGFHVMDYPDATNFTVSTFIGGNEWLGSTSFPFDDDI